MTSKTRKRLSKEDSTTICETCNRFKGKWDSIMADPEVKRIGYGQGFLSSHLNNEKKKIKRDVSNVDKVINYWFVIGLAHLFMYCRQGKREEILRKLEGESSSEDEQSSEKELMVIEVSQKRYNRRYDYF
jgi:hypothetical protein